MFYLNDENFVEEDLGDWRLVNLGGLLEESIMDCKVSLDDSLLMQRQIVEYAKFIIVVDRSQGHGVEWREKHGELSRSITYYPLKIKIEKAEYQLCGRVLATRSTGFHFKAMCTILNGDVYEFDNMKSSPKKVKRIDGKIKYTGLVIYRQLTLDQELQEK